MRHYELLVTLPGTLTETELKPKLKQIKSTLEEFDTEDIEAEGFGKTKLAYPVDGIEYGYYYQFRYNIKPSQVNDLRSELNKQQSLLRVVLNQIDSDHEDRVNKVRSLNGRDEILELIEQKHSDKEDEKEDIEQSQEKNSSTKKKKSKDSQQKQKGGKETKRESQPEESEKTNKKQSKQDDKDKQKEQKQDKEKDEDVSLDEIDDKLDEIIEGEDLPEV